MKLGKGPRPNLYCANGCTREQLSELALTALGASWQPPAKPDEKTVQEARAAKQAAALRLWNGSEPCPGSIAARYLANRGLPDLASSPALRFRGDCWHAERSKHPALIASVRDTAGVLVAVHRTYLDREGRKANVTPSKASLGPVWTGAIHLDAAAPEMLVGEGVETAASAGLLLGLPAWAALSAGNMAAALVLPPEVRTITIAADADGPGLRAAKDGAARWRREGRTVRLATPDRPGQDFNDLLLEGVHA